MSFCKDLRICLKELHTCLQRERERERSIFHLLFHSPSVHNSQGKAMLKPGTGASAMVPAWVQGPKHLGHLPLVSQVHHQGTESRLEQLRHKPALQWDLRCRYCSRKLSCHHHNACCAFKLDYLNMRKIYYPLSNFFLLKRYYIL